ncbi:MAG: hypothetical protein AAGB01_08830, partial [Cyanobacteria bacterium P01_F01_bin.42]
ISLLGLMAPQGIQPAASPVPTISQTAPRPISSPPPAPSRPAPSHQGPPLQSASPQTSIPQNAPPQSSPEPNSQTQETPRPPSPPLAPAAPQEPQPAVSQAPRSPEQSLPSSSPPPTPLPTAPVQPEPAEPVVAPSANSQLDLTEVWHGLQQHLSPLASALLRQHGHLAKLKSNTAVIGISTKQLAKIAQSRIDDIETAFEQFLQKKIKVSIEVISQSNDESPPSASSPPLPAPAYSAPAVAPPPAAPSPPAMSAPRTSAPTASSTAAESNNGFTKSPVSAPQPPTDTPNTWEVEDSTTYAAKNFAQFFNGALVDLPDETDSENSETEKSKSPQ